MELSKWRPSPGTVLGLLALVVAVAGTAMAGPLATTSVLSKGEKKQVRKIAKGQVNKLAPGLAVASAKSANTANSANTAGNANLLDGLDSSAFASAAEVHSPGRIVLNDPIPGDPNFVESEFNIGSFTVRARCSDNWFVTTDDVAELLVVGPAGSSDSGSRTDGSQVNSPVDVSSVPLASIFSDGGNVMRGGYRIVAAPNGQVMTVIGSAELNDPAGDCVFGVTAIGP